MRLIDATKVVYGFTIEFHTPLHEEDDGYEGRGSSDSSKYKYAILSHTWGWQDEKTGKWAHQVDEITYNECQNFSNPFDGSLNPDKQKAYQKIYYTCSHALDLGCDYVWIDSCCIDKSDSAELTESINSMFRWYSEAEVCLVYLVDSYSCARAPCRRLYTKDDTPCRWFSRCWTLQELLASRKLVFYDSQWNLISKLQKQDSNKKNFEREISKITKINAEAFLGRVPLWQYSVEAKMSWAASRKARRPEDIAYSLLGLFDIHMPLIYGEGAGAAFQRLQLEIIKSTPDLSIFAWHTEEPDQDGQLCSALANSPSQFRFHRRICRVIPEMHHTMTNKGIQMTSVVHRVPTPNGEKYILCLEDEEKSSNKTGIFLRKTGYNVFQRTGNQLAEIKNLKKYPSTHRFTFYITCSPQHNPQPLSLDINSIHVPSEYQVDDVIPEACWDCENRVLLGKIPCSDGVRALKLSTNTDRGWMSMTLLFRSSILTVFDSKTHVATTNKLFTRAHRREFMSWGDLLSKIPEFGDFRSTIDMTKGRGSSVNSCNEYLFHLIFEFVPAAEISSAAVILRISAKEISSETADHTVTGVARPPSPVLKRKRKRQTSIPRTVYQQNGSKNDHQIVPLSPSILQGFYRHKS
ncbi:heterokaryon incompatibility protein-domain-containing protein [Nemania abortiva]|nr:heterokaryon incompatibility protein-domain-containing protein [Nemania abortiva]